MRSKHEAENPPPGTRRQRPIRGQIIMDKETARRVHLARWRRFVLAFLAIAIISATIGLYTSPLLRVQKIEVVGATAVSTDEVGSLARLDSQSMMRLDLASAQDRVETIPMVESARLERRWPQTIRVVITERTPWAFWQAGADRFVIDSEGVVLPGSAPLENGPVIADLRGPLRLMPGDRVDSDAVLLARALLERVPEKLAMNIASLEYTPQQGLAITTDAGYRVVVGDSQNVDYKLAVWQAIEERLGRETMAGHVLDLRFGDRPSFQ
jgi:cell division septal protein FtsQ